MDRLPFEIDAQLREMLGPDERVRFSLRTTFNREGNYGTTFVVLTEKSLLLGDYDQEARIKFIRHPLDEIDDVQVRAPMLQNGQVLFKSGEILLDKVVFSPTVKRKFMVVPAVVEQLQHDLARKKADHGIDEDLSGIRKATRLDVIPQGTGMDLQVAATPTSKGLDGRFVLDVAREIIAPSPVLVFSTLERVSFQKGTGRKAVNLSRETVVFEERKDVTRSIRNLAEDGRLPPGRYVIPFVYPVTEGTPPTHFGQSLEVVHSIDVDTGGRSDIGNATRQVKVPPTTPTFQFRAASSSIDGEGKGRGKLHFEASLGSGEWREDGKVEGTFTYFFRSPRIIRGLELSILLMESVDVDGVPSRFMMDRRTSYLARTSFHEGRTNRFKLSVPEGFIPFDTRSGGVSCVVELRLDVPSMDRQAIQLPIVPE